MLVTKKFCYLSTVRKIEDLFLDKRLDVLSIIMKCKIIFVKL
jgi:hypothetical protein